MQAPHGREFALTLIIFKAKYTSIQVATILDYYCSWPVEVIVITTDVEVIPSRYSDLFEQ